MVAAMFGIGPVELVVVAVILLGIAAVPIAAGVVLFVLLRRNKE